MTWQVEHDPPVLVEVVRCGVVESSHRGHVAVLDGPGLLTHHLGAVTVPPSWSNVEPYCVMTPLVRVPVAK